MSRTQKRQSPLAALASLAVALAAVGLMVAIVPGMLTSGIRSAMQTPAPSGVNWTPDDASTCLATANALLKWPDDKGGPVSRIGLGLSDDVAGARPTAVQSARDFGALARRSRAPGADGELAAYSAAIEAAAAAFAKPITVSDFRANYRAIGGAANRLLIQCHSVEGWVRDNYKR